MINFIVKSSRYRLATLCFTFSVFSCFTNAQCPPQGNNKNTLLELREQQFTIDNENARQQLAIELIPCLKSIDPQLRDQVAFEAFSTWMREKSLTEKTRTTLLNELLSWLPDKAPDPAGVAKPFAVLVLAEVARVDRFDPFLSIEQRQQLVTAVSQYLTTLNDYRGFDETVGWRHGIAHSADAILQLALNPQITADQLQTMATAIGEQIVPSNNHFYIYGESQRLARAIFYLTQTKLIDNEWWDSWFASLNEEASSTPLYQSQNGLALRHNLMNFFTIFYLYMAENAEPENQALFLPHIRNGIAALN